MTIENFKKAGIIAASSLATLTVGSIFIGNVKDAERSERAHMQLGIAQKSPNKLQELLRKEQTTRVDWKQALKEIDDSLRIDSIARTNYAKGMQQVRDSINTQRVKDSIKTVSKVIK